MRIWSVDTGAPKEELDGGSFAFSHDSTSGHKMVKYSITFKKDLLLISAGQSAVTQTDSPAALVSLVQIVTLWCKPRL